MGSSKSKPEIPYAWDRNNFFNNQFFVNPFTSSNNLFINCDIDEINGDYNKFINCKIKKLNGDNNIKYGNLNEINIEIGKNIILITESELIPQVYPETINNTIFNNIIIYKIDGNDNEFINCNIRKITGNDNIFIDCAIDEVEGNNNKFENCFIRRLRGDFNEFKKIVIFIMSGLSNKLYGSFLNQNPFLFDILNGYKESISSYNSEFEQGTLVGEFRDSIHFTKYTKLGPQKNFLGVNKKIKNNNGIS